MRNCNAFRKRLKYYNLNIIWSPKNSIYYLRRHWIFVKKIDGCGNNLFNNKNSSATKTGEHIPCGYSISTIWGFDHIEDKHTLYRRKDCMKRFCECLRGHTKSVIVFEKKKILSLTIKELKSYKDAEKCYICGIKFFKNLFRDKNYRKVRDHCHYTGKYRSTTHSICNLKFLQFFTIVQIMIIILSLKN